MSTRGRDIIVIGASAGGLQALIELARGLPADLPASIFVVVHTAPDNPGILPQILERVGSWPAGHPTDHQPIEQGRIYIAPPDHHLLVKRGHMRVIRGPKENSFRPAVDPLFRTAAKAYGPNVLGVILSGGLDDGTYGLTLIKDYGGKAVVQDPDEALIPSMPQSAIRMVAVDHVVRVAEMLSVIEQLVREPLTPGEISMGSNGESEEDVVEKNTDALQDGSLDGPPSAFTCPECGGSLWERSHGNLLRFRCHTGHAYSSESLLAEQADNLESTLAVAMRALEENAALHRRLVERARKAGLPTFIETNERKAEEAERRAQQLRDFLLTSTVTELASSDSRTKPTKGVGRRRNGGSSKG